MTSCESYGRQVHQLRRRLRNEDKCIANINPQGTKTKFVSWINSIIPHEFEELWIESFMGTGDWCLQSRAKLCAFV